MPGKITKTSKGVRVTWGGKVVAKHTTMKKAKSQMRLLQGIKHGWKPTKQRRR